MVLHTQLNRLLAFDAETAVVQCETGVTIADLIDVFLPRGYFPAVTPGTWFLTMDSAIAADIHGKNHHRDGSIASFVDQIELLSDTGQIITCSRQVRPDVFWATVGGMGLTGVILGAAVHLKPVETAYLTVDYESAANLDDALAQFCEGDQTYPYSVAWIDCRASGRSVGHSVLMRSHPTSLSQLPQRYRNHPLQVAGPPRKVMPLHLPHFALGATAVRLFNSAYHALHPTRPDRIVHYALFFYPLDAVTGCTGGAASSIPGMLPTNDQPPCARRSARANGRSSAGLISGGAQIVRPGQRRPTVIPFRRPHEFTGYSQPKRNRGVLPRPTSDHARVRWACLPSQGRLPRTGSLCADVSIRRTFQINQGRAGSS